MLEVVFSESVKVSMMQAKVYDEKDMEDISISYIGKKPSKAELRKGFKGQAIGGSLKDVVNIGLDLDIGDISESVDGIERKEIFKNIFDSSYDEKEGQRFFDDQKKDLKKLISSAKEGKDIRIWTSSSPHSACGFAFVCNLLKDIDCNISMVSFPQYHHISEDTVLTSASWNAVAPNEFYKFLSYEKEISNIIKQIQADLWDELKEENAPLRAVVNGKLISVPEDFYDHIIINNIPDEEFTRGMLIGKIIGEYELGVGDTWFAQRINKMIEDKKLKVVSHKNSSHPYDLALKKF